MPFRDRTGPQGLGPMTGRRRGLCVGNTETPPFYGYHRRGRGMGLGRGRGFGKGFGRGFNRYQYEEISKEEEKKILKDEINHLKHNIEFMSDRLNELEESSDSEDK
jgi:hypothetical protein